MQVQHAKQVPASFHHTLLKRQICRKVQSKNLQNVLKRILFCAILLAQTMCNETVVGKNTNGSWMLRKRK